MQPVDRIAPVRPVPSLLTSARDRTKDNFGVGAIAALDDGVDGFPTSSASWRTGISWNPVSCNIGENYPQCGGGEDKGTDSVDAAVNVSPFWIYTSLVCDWTTLDSEGKLDSDAEAVLEAASAAGLAKALWMGEGYVSGDTTPTLRNSAQNATVVAGTAMDPDDAMAVLLEEYEACTEKGGAMLHVPPVSIPGLIKDGRVSRDGDLYRGPLDLIVSPGPGNPVGISLQGAGGFGPAISDGIYRGNAGDEVWWYITGIPEYALGPPVPTGSADNGARNPRINRYEALAERQAIIRFDPCCTFAAKVESVPVVVT